jgi:hypothetical protein
MSVSLEWLDSASVAELAAALPLSTLKAILEEQSQLLAEESIQAEELQTARIAAQAAAARDVEMCLTKKHALAAQQGQAAAIRARAAADAAEIARRAVTQEPAAAFTDLGAAVSGRVSALCATIGAFGASQLQAGVQIGTRAEREAHADALSAACAAGEAERVAAEAEASPAALAALRASLADDSAHEMPTLQALLRGVLAQMEGGAVAGSAGAGVGASDPSGSLVSDFAQIRDASEACMWAVWSALDGHAPDGEEAPPVLPARKLAASDGLGPLTVLARKTMAAAVLELRAFERIGPLLCGLAARCAAHLSSGTEVEWAALSLELALASDEPAVCDATDEAATAALAAVALQLHRCAKSLQTGVALAELPRASVLACCRLVVAMAVRPCGTIVDWQPVAESAICLSAAAHESGARAVTESERGIVDGIDAACEDMLTALLLLRPSAVASAVTAVTHAFIADLRAARTGAPRTSAPRTDVRMDVCLSLLNCAQLVALACREPHASGFGASPVLPTDPAVVASEWRRATQHMCELSRHFVYELSCDAFFCWEMMLAGFAIASAPLGAPITADGLAALGLPAEAPAHPGELAHSWGSLVARYIDGFVTFYGLPQLVERLRWLEARVQGPPPTPKLASPKTQQVKPKTPSQQQAAAQFTARKARRAP